MPTRLDSKFSSVYLEQLPLTLKTRTSYRQYIRWIERYGNAQLTLVNLRTADFISRFIDGLAKRYDADHKKNFPNENITYQYNRKTATKNILKHYERFLQSAESEIAIVEKQLEIEDQFDAKNIQDGRLKVLRSIALRKGQPKFRRKLMAAYQGRCAVTGTAIEAVLEAAHIVPYNGESTNHICNGLLLRSDIHALFDLGYLSVDPDNLRIHCSENVRGDAMYGDLHGSPLKIPVNCNERPDYAALRVHFEESMR